MVLKSASCWSAIFMSALCMLPQVGSCEDKMDIIRARRNVMAAQEGTDKSVDSDASKQGITIQDAELGAIIKVFSQQLGRNYILDERVKGKVTMYLPGYTPTEDLLKILDTTLALKGFTAVPVGENLWKILPSREAAKSTIPTIKASDNPNSNSGTLVTKLMRPTYVAVADIQPLLAQLVSPDGLVSAYNGTNSLLVIDYEDNVQRISEIVGTVDIPFYDQDMVMIPIRHASAADVAEKIKELMLESSQDSNNSRTPNSRVVSINRAGAPAGAPISTTSTVTGPLRSREPKILADERTNSLIIVADDDTTARIKALVSELDSPIDKSNNRFYVYRCQHANAEDLSEVLAGLVGSGSSGGGGGRLSNASSSLSGSSSNMQSGRLDRTSRTPGQPRSGGNSASSQQVQLGENFSISSDPATNSLIIQGSKSDYQKVLELIKELDIKRRQVLVEGIILEVGVNSQDLLSSDFISSTGGADGGLLANSNQSGGLAGLLENPTQLSGFSVAAASAGTLSIGQDLVIPSQSILVRAAQNNSNANILSAPTLLATDNEEAQIVVGSNVPFLTSTSTNQTNLNNTFNQISRQDVGITLRLTPQINSNDFVNLKIFTDVSAVVPSSDSTLGPTTSVRSSETTVITRDGQMIVIGGLMSDQSNDSDNGVPFLKDIPLIGGLFRSSTDVFQRTNLLTFIRPRIIKDQFDARDETAERVKETSDVIKEYNHTPNREEILKSPAIDHVAELGDPDEIEDIGTIRARSSGGVTYLPSGVVLDERAKLSHRKAANKAEAAKAPLTEKQTSERPGSVNLGNPLPDKKSQQLDRVASPTEAKINLSRASKPRIEVRDIKQEDFAVSPKVVSEKIEPNKGTASVAQSVGSEQGASVKVEVMELSFAEKMNDKVLSPNGISERTIAVASTTVDNGIGGNPEVRYFTFKLDKVVEPFPFERFGNNDQILLQVNGKTFTGKAASFFEVGRRYRFGTHTGVVTASNTVNNVKVKPHQMSIYELNNLGSGPWYKVDK